MAAQATDIGGIITKTLAGGISGTLTGAALAAAIAHVIPEGQMLDYAIAGGALGGIFGAYVMNIVCNYK